MKEFHGMSNVQCPMSEFLGNVQCKSDVSAFLVSMSINSSACHQEEEGKLEITITHFWLCS